MTNIRASIYLVIQMVEMVLGSNQRNGALTMVQICVLLIKQTNQQLYDAESGWCAKQQSELLSIVFST